MERHDADMDGERVEKKESIINEETKEVRRNNVSELVAKSKKAALSLWTLLHAKNCRMGMNLCTQIGCPSAKLILLHLKTCTAFLLEPCPSQHKGCQDARKLLAHYRRCRDIRARQVQNPAVGSQHHVCIVCSLVARHAVFSLDRTALGCRSSSIKPGGTSSHFIPSLVTKNDESFDVQSNASTTTVSFGLSYDNNPGFLSSPPSTSSSQRFAFSRPTNGSSRARGFQALLSASSMDQIGKETVELHGYHKKRQSRPRSESFDARSIQYSREEKHEDGTKNMSYLYLAAVERLEEPASHSRRRSLSCSVPSASSTSVDQMLSKPMGEDLQCILGGD